MNYTSYHNRNIPECKNGGVVIERCYSNNANWLAIHVPYYSQPMIFLVNSLRYVCKRNTCVDSKNMGKAMFDGNNTPPHLEIIGTYYFEGNEKNLKQGTVNIYPDNTKLVICTLCSSDPAEIEINQIVSLSGLTCDTIKRMLICYKLEELMEIAPDLFDAICGPCDVIVTNAENGQQIIPENGVYQFPVSVSRYLIQFCEIDGDYERITSSVLSSDNDTDNLPIDQNGVVNIPTPDLDLGEYNIPLVSANCNTSIDIVVLP